MGSHNTNNSLQSAFFTATTSETTLLLASLTSALNVYTPTPLCKLVRGTTTGGRTIFLDLVALIATTVQKAVTAERSQYSGQTGLQSVQALSCSSNDNSSGALPHLCISWLQAQGSWNLTQLTCLKVGRFLLCVSRLLF